ncbi:MAG: hypothetical protein QXY76_03360 [Nitrososphaeria archaeon]
MPLIGDIVSTRGEGLTSIPSLPNAVEIGIVAPAKGAIVEKTIQSGNHVLSSRDILSLDTVYVTSITKVVDADGRVYYPTTDFKVYDYTDPGSPILLDPAKIPFLKTTNVRLAWDYARQLTLLYLNKSVQEAVSGLPAGTYTFYVYPIDLNSRAGVGKSVTVTLEDDQKVILLWEPTGYVSGYEIYVQTTDGLYKYGTTLPSSSISLEITSIQNWTEATALPTPSGRIEPVAGSPYTVYCTVAVPFENITVKTFTSLDEVISTIGKGSVAYNIAEYAFTVGVRQITFSLVPECRLVINNEALIEVYPTDNDYRDAIDALDLVDIEFLAIVPNKDTLFTYAMQKVEALSDKVFGQKERYLIWAPQVNSTSYNFSSLDTLISAVVSSSSYGKRCLLVVPNIYPGAGKVKVNSWVVSPTSILTNSEVTVKISESEEFDISAILEAVYLVLNYIASDDPAESMAEKFVSGVYHDGKLMSMQTMRTYADKGVCLLVSEKVGLNPYCYRFVNASLQRLSIEDAEMSIALVEDLMDKEIREYMKRFRGTKALPSRLDNIKFQFKRYVLSAFVNRGWIELYDEGSVKLWMDELDPTRLKGSFTYKPIYPINRIWIEHTFII